jgi:hypothetical protein
VSAVQNFGAGDLLEIAPAAGGPTVLLPFTDAVVPIVDVPNGRVVVNPPPEGDIPPLKGEGGERSEPGGVESEMRRSRRRPPTRSRYARSTSPEEGEV